MFFANRHDAGRRLAQQLAAYRAVHPVVLALPRGGVVVGYEIAHALGAPLDVLVVRKLGAPGRPELAIGAVAPGATVVDDEAVWLLNISSEYLADAIEREREAVERRVRLYRGVCPALDLHRRTVLLVDDGMATGSTARAALDAARELGAERVVVAVPVAAPEAVERLRGKAEVVCLATPSPLGAVGYWYEDFGQTTDDQVCALLKRARLEREAHYEPSGIQR